LQFNAIHSLNVQAQQQEANQTRSGALRALHIDGVTIITVGHICHNV
jgi:hypothetical protein